MNLQPLERPSGLTSEQLTNDAERALKVQRESNRNFSDSNEDDRRIHYSNMMIKDHAYYNKTDNLWNETKMLHPKKHAIYSEKNIDPKTTFKKQLTDLEEIKSCEEQDKFVMKFQNINSNKVDYSNRN